MEARYQIIETEMRNQKIHQVGMDNHLLQLEHHTTTMYDNIAAMMAHWRTTPAQKRKANKKLADTEYQQMQLEDTGHHTQAASSHNMDQGDEDECL